MGNYDSLLFLSMKNLMKILIREMYKNSTIKFEAIRDRCRGTDDDLIHLVVVSCKGDPNNCTTLTLYHLLAGVCECER